MRRRKAEGEAPAVKRSGHGLAHLLANQSLL